MDEEVGGGAVEVHCRRNGGGGGGSRGLHLDIATTAQRLSAAAAAPTMMYVPLWGHACPRLVGCRRPFSIPCRGRRRRHDATDAGAGAATRSNQRRGGEQEKNKTQPYRGLPHLIKPTPYERAQQTPTSHAPLTTSSAPLPFRQALIRASTATPSSTRLVSLLRLYTEAGSRQQPAHDRPIRHTPGARQARLTWPSPPRRAPLPPARARRAPPAGGR